MLPGVKSRLGVVGALLSFQVTAFAAEIFLFLVPTDQPSTWYTISRHLIAPLSVGLLGVILTPITFVGNSFGVPGLNSECETNFDADICGDSVRISIWAQAAVLIVIALLGSFHTGKLGAKEVGAGLILTHISLIIALLLQMGRASLNSVDALIGSMILDAQNVALSIQLASKETLAARWQVRVVLFCQTFSLVVLPLAVDGFTRGRFETPECRCLTVLWWGWLTNCPNASPSGSNENTVFWLYYAFRVVMFLQSAFHSGFNTTKFHLAEKYAWRTLEGITFPSPPYPVDMMDKLEYIKYADYPSTAALLYAVHGVFAMTSLAAAEVTIRDFNLRPSSEVYLIG